MKSSELGRQNGRLAGSKTRGWTKRYIDRHSLLTYIQTCIYFGVLESSILEAPIKDLSS